MSKVTIEFDVPENSSSGRYTVSFDGPMSFAATLGCVITLINAIMEKARLAGATDINIDQVFEELKSHVCTKPVDH
jgi:hypothetical protein